MKTPTDDNPYLALGLRVAAYRNRRGLLQRELAAEMDIDPAILSKIENGTRRATRDQAQWLAANANIAMKWWGYSRHDQAMAGGGE